MVDARKKGSDPERREDMSKHSTLRLSKRMGFLLFACMFFVALGHAQNASAVVRVSAGVNFHTGGYDLLAQYGDWMRVPPYGVVWCPYVDASWAPFYDGRWIWTRGGWAWDSYEPFGDMVYHYGYWYFDRNIGWFWVPGYEWSPARVQWYTYGSYCGWAPMPPPNYYWPNPWDHSSFNIWVVVHINNFYNDHIGRHGIDRSHYRDVFRREGVVKRAPEVRQVETVVRRRIPVETITRRPMDIRTDRIEVAERPAIQRVEQLRDEALARRDVRDAKRAEQPTERLVIAPSQKRVIAPSQQRVARPGSEADLKRGAAQPDGRARAVVRPGNAAPERKAVRSKETAPKPAESKAVERKAKADKQSARTEQRAAAASENARVAKSRTDR